MRNTPLKNKIHNLERDMTRERGDRLTEQQFYLTKIEALQRAQIQSQQKYDYLKMQFVDMEESRDKYKSIVEDLSSEMGSLKRQISDVSPHVKFRDIELEMDEIRPRPQTAKPRDWVCRFCGATTDRDNCPECHILEKDANIKNPSCFGCGKHHEGGNVQTCENCKPKKFQEMIPQNPFVPSKPPQLQEEVPSQPRLYHYAPKDPEKRRPSTPRKTSKCEKCLMKIYDPNATRCTNCIKARHFRMANFHWQCNCQFVEKKKDWHRYMENCTNQSCKKWKSNAFMFACDNCRTTFTSAKEHVC